MAKKLLKRFLPDAKKIKNNKSLKIFGKFLHDPNLWHLNRHSVATAVGIGLFVAYIPSPGHMLVAALLAILLRANLPIAVVLVWVSNPITIPFQFFFAYKLGAFILHTPHHPFSFEISMEWFMAEIKTIGIPLFLGSFILGTLLAVLGNLFVRVYWRFSVAQSWRKRAKNRKK